MDPLTLLGLGSFAANYFQRPKFMRGPEGAGIAALQTLGPGIPYAINPILGGINSLLEIGNATNDAFQFSPGKKFFDFAGDVIDPAVSKLNERQFFEYLDSLPKKPRPFEGEPFGSGPPNLQTTNNNSGGGNAYTMPSQPTPQKSFINAPAFQGMGYTRGR